MMNKSSSYMLAVAASIYGVLAYTIAFSLEIWFIFNSDNSDENSFTITKNDRPHREHETQFIIPMTALIQASIYFVLVILSLFLILGVIIKSVVCLLCWIIAIILAFLPESCLVVYTCLNVWKIDTRNGQIELGFFVFRFIMNTFFVIFVYNLIKQWKTEKMMANYMSSRDAFSTYPYITATSLRLKKSPTFLAPTSLSNYDTYTKYNQATNCYGSVTLNDLAKFKSLSVKGLYDFNSYPYYSYFDGFETQLPDRDEQQFPSEFDTNSFRNYKMIRKPMNPADLEMADEKRINLDEQHYSSKKSLAPSDMDLTSLNPSTTRNSMSTRSITNSTIDVQQTHLSGDNVVLRQLATRPFEYLARPGSVSNLNMQYESDENYNLMNQINKENLKKSSDKGKRSNTHSLRDVAL